MVTQQTLKATLLALSFSAFSYTAPALAQDGPPTCADGSDGSNGCHAQVVYVEPAPTITYTSSKPDSYYSIMWHKNANNMWLAINYPSVNHARKAAAKACKQVMGNGCFEDGVNNDLYHIVYRTNDGLIGRVREATPEEAEQIMQAECEKTRADCVIINRADSRGETKATLITPQGDPRHIYAAAAMAVKIPRATAGANDVFIASGMATREEAEKAALSACRKKIKKKCEIRKSIVDTHLIVGIDDGKGVWVGSAHDPNVTATLLEDFCNDESKSCTIRGSFSAKDKGVQAFDAYADK
jgi:hypothetical protein